MIYFTIILEKKEDLDLESHSIIDQSRYNLFLLLHYYSTSLKKEDLNN